MADTVNDSELGRNKHSSTPADHLLHLLNVGWSPTAPLIVKYVQDNHLTRELNDWQSVQEVAPQKTRTK